MVSKQNYDMALATIMIWSGKYGFGQNCIRNYDMASAMKNGTASAMKYDTASAMNYDMAFAILTRHEKAWKIWLRPELRYGFGQNYDMASARITIWLRPELRYGFGQNYDMASARITIHGFDHVTYI